MSTWMSAAQQLLPATLMMLALAFQVQPLLRAAPPEPESAAKGTAGEKPDEASVLGELERAKKLATKQAYRLRYKLKKGDLIKWRIVHLATTETTIQEQPETSRTRSVAIRSWKVLDVDDVGNATVQLTVEELEMWQKVSDRDEVTYNSRTDKTAPPEYLQAAETVGVPLLTAKVTPSGQIVARDRPKENFDLGLGQMTIPFPEKPQSPGQSWYVPRQLLVQLPGGTIKRIKIRQKHTLVKVETGVATIRIVSQPITPIDNPQIEAQLMQDLIDGTVRFDLDKGCLLSRQVDWDETVVEFAGPSSMIKYRARLTEKLVPAETNTADARAGE